MKVNVDPEKVAEFNRIFEEEIFPTIVGKDGKGV